MIREIIDKVRGIVTKRYVDSFDLVILFGSIVENRFNILSDVDLAVKPSGSRDILDVVPLFIVDVAMSLNIIEDKIDVLILNSELPLELEFNVLRNGVLIYDRGGTYDEMLLKSFSKYADYIIFLKKLDLRRRYIAALERKIYGEAK